MTLGTYAKTKSYQIIGNVTKLKKNNGRQKYFLRIEHV